jgi:hypothetical protein
MGTKEEAAMEATYVLTRVADFARRLFGDDSPRILILVAQVGSDDGPVNVGVSWPADRKEDAAIVARESANVFDRQAGAS